MANKRYKNQKYKRWFLEGLYVIGMLYLLVEIIRLTGLIEFTNPYPTIYQITFSFILLLAFGLLYLKWFKLWEYEEYENQ